jgi:aldehyde dehydrogenase (NAD+)
MNAQIDDRIFAADLAHPDKLYIGGKWVAPQSKNKLKLVNPANDKPFFEVCEASEADMQAAVGAARRAFDKGPWPRLPPSERAEKMRALGEALLKRSAALERAWVTQIGMPVSMATGSVMGVVTAISLRTGVSLI